jgi:hypothetical protein
MTVWLFESPSLRRRSTPQAATVQANLAGRLTLPGMVKSEGNPGASSGEPLPMMLEGGLMAMANSRAAMHLRYAIDRLILLKQPSAQGGQ